MSATRERLAAAVAKLEEARQQTVDSGKVDWATMVLMLRTLPGVLCILQNDLGLLDSCKTDDERERFTSAFERAGDAAVVEVLTDPVRPNTGDELSPSAGD